MDKKHYFAYGSNMDCGQMRKRCPDAEFIKVAYLKGYRFVYDGYSEKRHGAVANIVPSPSDTVWGILYKISERDEKSLDRCEGYPSVYDKKYVKVCDKNGKEYEALVYYRERREIGEPSKQYEELIVSSALKHNLPAEYIDKYLRVQAKTKDYNHKA